jgi:predicted nucleotidyltransferase
MSNICRFTAPASLDIESISDLDMYGLDKTSLWFPVRLIRDLENFVGIKIGIVTPEGLKTRIRNQILQESLPL